MKIKLTYNRLFKIITSIICVFDEYKLTMLVESNMLTIHILVKYTHLVFNSLEMKVMMKMRCYMLKFVVTIYKEDYNHYTFFIYSKFVFYFQMSFSLTLQFYEDTLLSYFILMVENIYVILFFFQLCNIKFSQVYDASFKTNNHIQFK